MEAWPVSLGALALCALLLAHAAPERAPPAGFVSGEQINDSRSLSGFADHSSLAEAINIQLEDSVKLEPTSGGRQASSLVGADSRPGNTSGARFRRRLKSSNLPELSPISNVSAVVGRDVRLVCLVEHLGQYQVAWLKEETHTILSIDTNIIITNYRIFLIPDTEERKWVLHIKDVQESDRGFYQCQVNTNPMRSTRGYLEVNVPPSIIESQSSQLAEVLEHGDVKIQCKANGHPKPIVTWRRDDGFPIRIHNKFIGPTSDNSNLDNNQPLEQDAPGNSQPMVSELSYIRSDRLSLLDADKQMAGNYVCTASNGIPPQAIKKIPLYVKFPAKVILDSPTVVVSLGDQVEVDCTIEAYPMADSSWIRSAYAYSHQKLSLNEDLSDSMDKLSGRPSRLDIDRKSHRNNRRQVRHLPRLKSEVRFSGATSNWTDDVVKDIRGHFTVQRIALGTTSYKIRMIIYKVQPTDFGQYTCTASNVLGDAQAHVTLTKREKTDEKNVDKNYQQDASPSLQKSTRVNTPFRPNVFDENYLNSIHQHQKNKATSNRWRSKYSKNTLNTGAKQVPSLVFVIMLIITTTTSQVWIRARTVIRAN